MDMSILEKEMNEIHSYVRHNISLFLTWYTFFITANLVGLQWFVNQADKSQSTNFRYYMSSTLGFVFVNALGFLQTKTIQAYLKSSDARVHQIIEIVSKHMPENTIIEIYRSAVPLKFYSKTLRAIKLSLVAVSVAWLLLLVLICLEWK